MLCKIASTRKARSAVDRNLRRCIHKAGVTLPVDVVLVATVVQLVKPRYRAVHMYWPCLSMQSWIKVLAEQYPMFLLGGFKLDEAEQWRRLFSWFWDMYRQYDPEHPVFAVPDMDLSLAVPFMTHGDEGRGLASSAFMVESWQLVISHLGPFTTNVSGQLVLTRPRI